MDQKVSKKLKKLIFKFKDHYDKEEWVDANLVLLRCKRLIETKVEDDKEQIDLIQDMYQLKVLLNEARYNDNRVEINLEETEKEE